MSEGPKLTLSELDATITAQTVECLTVGQRARMMAMRAHKSAVEEMILSDTDYKALRRHRLVKGIYSLPRDESGDAMRFFVLTQSGRDVIAHLLEQPA